MFLRKSPTNIQRENTNNFPKEKSLFTFLSKIKTYLSAAITEELWEKNTVEFQFMIKCHCSKFE